eukprot:CAMPEP_0114252670 /NCGR_PEP_ID=MMETSP0058-20121206/15963_1 /TAXON_ID=36894 /ORGANISM="Pyramimonas parkeae, CCMP726" /LENGTH=138 /DNA_ID=CAMNT_0001366625 /DNA_START=133 /DNA_END=549 /DNA_ORIENTATION=+
MGTPLKTYTAQFRRPMAPGYTRRELGVSCRAGPGRDPSPSRDHSLQPGRGVSFTPEDLAVLRLRVKELEAAVRRDTFEMDPAPALPNTTVHAGEISISALTAEVAARDAHEDIVDWHEQQWEKLRLLNTGENSFDESM